MDNNIRPAKIEDTSRIAEMEIFNYRLSFYHLFLDDWFYFDELRVIPMAKKYADNLAGVYVYDDGAVKGFVKVDGKEIKKLFVEPVLQSKGIGKKLLDYVVQNHNADFLWAFEKNERAIAFYERNGFHITKERKLEDGSDTYYLVMMRKNGG